MKIIAPLKNTFHNTDALHNSSNINELVKTVLNYSFIIFFFTKRFHNYKKAQISKYATKNKKMLLKNI